MKNRLNNKYNCVLASFSCFVNSRRKEGQADETRYLFEQQTEVGSTIPPDTQNSLIIFLSVVAVMQVIFWTEDNFYFISDCGNSFKCKLKKLIINERIAISYSPPNALCSPEEFVQIKHFKHHTFTGMFSLWFNLQMMNFCLWRYIES